MASISAKSRISLCDNKSFFFVFPNYDIILPKSAQDKLKIEDEKDVAIYSIVVVPEDMEKMTTNLSGPIVINAEKKLGKQVILDDDRYTTKHYVFSKILKIGACKYANTVKEKGRIYHHRWKYRNKDTGD